MEYGLSNKEIESRLLKLVKISDPDNLIKTIFVWPEGVFSGYSYNEILQFKKLLKKILIKIILYYLGSTD